MFDIGAAELLVIVIVAILVIGPKDMPRAMRTAGRWIGKVRKVSAHFRTGIDAMVREAEHEDMEKKWKAQNEEIMRRTAMTNEAEHGEPVMTGPPPTAESAAAKPVPVSSTSPDSSADKVSDSQPEPSASPAEEARKPAAGNPAAPGE
ncbi:Sec-independent protein translocase protein TatB [Qipengyuania nanhaisediminis]|uniref:Sec-independent protein translocase protein TatB n=1 Tax=Qipengyuania nanhaisediminis TaxID=604088 RepID=UPI0038B302C9